MLCHEQIDSKLWQLSEARVKIRSGKLWRLLISPTVVYP